MPNLAIPLPLDRPLKLIFLKDDNLTVYYRGFDELLLLFDDLPPELKEQELTVEHSSSDTKKEKYHQGIDESYEDEGHVHYERSDRKALGLEDVAKLLSHFLNLNLLSSDEAGSIVLLLEKHFSKPQIAPVTAANEHKDIKANSVTGKKHGRQAEEVSLAGQNFLKKPKTERERTADNAAQGPQVGKLGKG